MRETFRTDEGVLTQQHRGCALTCTARGLAEYPPALSDPKDRCKVTVCSLTSWWDFLATYARPRPTMCT